MKEIINNTVKKLVVFALIIVAMIGIHTVSTAYTTTTNVAFPKNFNLSTMLPARDTSGPSGMLPQYYLQNAVRTVNLDDSRLNWATNKWNATMGGKVVYCSAYGRYVRYGFYDDATHFLIPGQTIIQGANIPISGTSVSDLKIEVQNNFIKEAKDYLDKEYEKGDIYYYKDTEKGIKASSSESQFTIELNDYTEDLVQNALGYVIEGTVDENGRYDLAGINQGLAMKDLENITTNAMQTILDSIGNAVAPGSYSSDIDNASYTGSSLTGVLGPEVVVLEQADHSTNQDTSKRYKENAGYIFENNQKAYIFSAAEDVYGNGNYAQKYTLNDIQGAYWLILNQEGDVKPGDHKITANARNLYNKSIEYANFLQKLQQGYNPSINTTETQVIADRGNKQYIVGPFSIDYPLCTDISYVKSLVINDNLVYDEAHEDFKIVLDGQGTKSNGMLKQYPQPGQRFFVVVSADKIGIDTTNIKLKANFEHINYTYAKVDTELTANANIYRYYGYSQITPDGTHRAISGVMTMTIYYQNGREDTVKIHEDGCNYENTGVCRCAQLHEEGCEYADNGDCTCEIEGPITKTTYYNTKERYRQKIWMIYQPYIKMGEQKVRTSAAQKLIVIGDAKREYVLKSAETKNKIDLTMELGGYVWVDADGGKEDLSNGLKDNNEVKVPNVPVTLYRKSENTGEVDKLIGTTKTNSKGEYRFTGLNPMYKYYVKFTYNGQYYQPTIFSDSSTWGTEKWTVNSNAKDVRSTRVAYNAKFESIGPSPNNYERTKGSGIYNETFTRLELLGFTLQKDSDGKYKYKKTREAVIDCQWTCKKENEANHVHEESCIGVVYGNLILESSSNATTQKMINYVKDCTIDAYTNADGANGLYPTPSKFLIGNGYIWSNGPKVLASNGISGISILYPNAYYINLGLDQRQDADLAVKKDIEKVTLEINGQTHDYIYETLDEDEQWEISVRLSDGYYNTVYSRAIYESDYIYKTDIYGDTDANNDGIGDKYGKSKKDELEVYITYKIMIDNQATSIQAKVNEVADYYDKDLEYIDERSYIEIKTGENKGRYAVRADDESRYNSVPETIIPGKDESGYDNLYITGLDDKYLTAGQRAYIYLTFRVEKDSEALVKIDEQIKTGEPIGVGKENLVEINGYSTRYADGTKVPNVNGSVGLTPAGIVDRDSKPGNIKDSGITKDNTNKEVYAKFEDDTDKSPNLVIKIDRNDDTSAREISGNVWEDLRDENIGETATGNGIRSNNENTLIDGVTVQLVELMANGTEYVWREFGDKGYTIEQFRALPEAQRKNGIGGLNTIGKGQGTGCVTSETPIINIYDIVKNYEFGNNKDGAYAFKSFVPGKYVVRFIYGDTIKTVAPESLGGKNAKSYNGQDYKSTTYQEGIAQNKTYEWRKASTWENGQEKLGDIIRKISTYDKNVCNQNATLVEDATKTYLYDITASDMKSNVSDAKDLESARKNVNKYSSGDMTNYLAEVLASGKADYNAMNDRTQLLNDLMQNTKMTAETGIMVIELEYDAVETDGTQEKTYRVQNVNLGLEERPKAQLIIDKEVANAKVTLANGSVLFDASNTVANVLWKDHKAYDVGYVKGLMDPAKFGNIENIRKRNANKFGLVQISMDEELMHGASIQITYKISAINVGEVDYNDNSFYYTGNVKNKNSVITTNAKQVIDYVANNLQFTANKNSNWKQITKDEIKNQGLVNEKIINELDNYNTIITSTSLDKDLVPSLYKQKVNNSAVDTVSTQLVLSKVLTPENNTDELTYRNIVEIVKTTNTAGRRMEYSVVGNQIPGHEPQELDTDIAEVVKILPPFGNAGIYIIITITAILALTIIILGTIFIKRKVLRK